MARRRNTNTRKVSFQGKSPFAEGSAAAKIDYAITRKVRSAYTKLFGSEFEPLYPDRQTKTPSSSPTGTSREVEAFRQNATNAHVKNVDRQLGEIKGILTEMSKTLKEIKTAVEEGGGGGILETLFGGMRRLLPGGRGGGASAAIPGGRPTSAMIPGAQNSSAMNLVEGLNDFMNPAVQELEAIREKLESENTIATKFSKTSDSARDLAEIAKNTEITANKTSSFDTSKLPPGWKHDPSTGATYLDKSNFTKVPVEPSGGLGVREMPKSPQPIIPIQPAAPGGSAVIPPQPVQPIQPAQPTPPIEPTNRADRVGGRRGKDHIGYGHRLTDEELRTGKIKLPDGTELDVNKGITKEDAEKLYQSDRSKLDDLTRKTLKNKGIDLDKLPPHVQDVMKDLGFNGPAIFNKNPKIVEGLKRGQTTGDYGDLAETVRGSMHTADGKVLGGLVKRANDRADAILDPNKKLDTKKFEGLETELYDPLVPKNKRMKDSTTQPTVNAASNLTDQQAENLTKLDRAIQESISRYAGGESKPYVPTPGLLDPLKPGDKKYTIEEQEQGINRLEDALKRVPTAQLEPTQRQTGPVLGTMETQLASARDQNQAGGAPTIINNTTNNAPSIGAGAQQGPVASIRNEESSLVRMQNMIAAGALS